MEAASSPTSSSTSHSGSQSTAVTGSSDASTTSSPASTSTSSTHEAGYYLDAPTVWETLCAAVQPRGRTPSGSANCILEALWVDSDSASFQDLTPARRSFDGSRHSQEAKALNGKCEHMSLFCTCEVASMDRPRSSLSSEKDRTATSCCSTEKSLMA